MMCERDEPDEAISNVLMKVVLLTNMIPPYRLEFYKELSYLCDLTVVCNTLVSPLRSWKQDESAFTFKYETLGQTGSKYNYKRSDAGYVEPRVKFNAKGIRERLSALKPDIVVSSEFGSRSIAAARYCSKNAIPLAIWFEGTLETEKAVGKLRTLLRRWLTQRASGFWTNGLASRQYLEKLGAKSLTITEGITGISTDVFYEAACDGRKRRKELREQLGASGTTFIFVGSLSGRKGLVQLLSALELLEERLSGDQECSFVFVGEGDFEASLKDLSEKFQHIKIILTGFQSEARVQELFAAADVFVLPTLDDNWPLVTLEALVSGLPQIGSIYNGASANLAEKGSIGIFLDPYNVDFLTDCLEKRVSEPTERVPEETVLWAKGFYSPESQAQRAYNLIQQLLSPPRT